jgi:hypothetical protein
MEKKYETGEVIKVENKGLQLLSEQVQTARFAYLQAVRDFENITDLFWKMANEEYPGIKNYQAFYNHEKHEITIIYPTKAGDV